jgi:type I restriction enzyme S subunit
MIKKIATIIMGQSPKSEFYNKNNEGLPLLNGAADYVNGVLCPDNYTTSYPRVCNKNDFVLCIRATIGNLVYAEREFCLGRGVAAVRVSDYQMSEQMYYVLLNEIEKFKAQATGSIIKGIIKDDLTDVKITIPNEYIKNKFHNLINPIFTKIRINKQQNQELAKLRDWLLPMLMNGQVKVKDSEYINNIDDILMVAEPKSTYDK